jgi:enamine deaminase RidA (YjgF/YER057c/UK114 family)
MDKALINPPGLAPAVGFTYVIAVAPRRLLFLAGQNGHDAEGRIAAPGNLTAQFDRTLANVQVALAAGGATLQDVVKMTLYVVDLPAYRTQRKAFGQVYRRYFGRYYPAMTLVGVSGLFDEDALIEVDCYAALET